MEHLVRSLRTPQFGFCSLPHAVLFSSFLFLLLLAGCGSGGVTGQSSEGAPTLTITASVTAISAGGSAVLSVTAANATQVTVTGTDGSSYTLAPTGGTQTVTPAATTTYTAVAVGAGGAKTSATTTVTVATGSTPTVAVSANPTSIAPGASSVLSVVSTNATQVTVTGTDGSSYTLQATGGTQTVTPAATTTYTAVASGAGGTKASATATVTVTTGPGSSAPIVKIIPIPPSIAAGGSSVLSVTATNATQVTVTGTDGSSYTLQSTGGTQTVTPVATTTYTATATGGGGKTTATATVTVAPTPTVTITASPMSIVQGGSSVLNVVATNATQVQIFGTDSPTLPYPYTLSPTGGTVTVTPTGQTTYTAIASNGSGVKVSATVTVAVGSAVSVTMTALPTSISVGGTSTLSVTAANATQVTVTGSDKTSFTLPPTGGTQSVTPSATTTYTATATGNAGGTSTATAIVTVVPAPTVALTATPPAIVTGGSSVLSVTATNASQVTITGTDGSSYSLPSSGGNQRVTPSATTTYTAIATGTTGSKVTGTATVTVGPGATVAITASPTSISAGSAAVLSVTATNATQVTVTGTDGSSYTLAPAGGTQSVSPKATTTYTAVASAASGNVSGTATITVVPAPTVTIAADPTSIVSGGSSVLTVTAANATSVTLTGSDSSSYTLQPTGGTQTVTPAANVTYTATATGTGGTASATATVSIVAAGSLQSVEHVVFMLQENHSFDNYFGMLNPYRAGKNPSGQNWSVGDDGVTYTVDGIDDKLTKISNSSDSNNGTPGTAYPLFKFTSTCIDDLTSAWLESYGDVNRYDFNINRQILMDGFVHTAQGFANSCQGGGCSGTFTDTAGKRAMGYYDGNFLNYYYYMASQFALSDRWFSPVASKSIDNRIATFTGGTTQGLTHDPGSDDHLGQLAIPTIFKALSNNKDSSGKPSPVSWKIYYTVTQGFCLSEDTCPANATAEFPAINFTALQDSYQYLYENPTGAACTGSTMSSQTAVGDPTNSFCIDTNHIAPLSTYYTDLTNGTLPSFAFIEAGYGRSDEHPGSGQSILSGQAEVANVVNSLMASTSWGSSVFFLAYDEGGGPYDHVPPVPGHSNDNTDAAVKANYPDIGGAGGIAVNPDGPNNYYPCLPPSGTPSLHCDLKPGEPGTTATDAAAMNGFGAQLGFRVPNIVISPFTRKHYVSHIPMDHTAILKFVEDRFITSPTYLTARDAAQPNLLNFFDFTNIPWATPPTPPAPASDGSGPSSCTPASFGP